MAYRDQFADAFSGRLGALFLVETDSRRRGAVGPAGRPATPLATRRRLLAGRLLTTLGIVFNRINVVLLAMDLRGAMPQDPPETYMPTVVEWGISIGLIAATIFLFGLAVRYCCRCCRRSVRAGLHATV